MTINRNSFSRTRNLNPDVKKALEKFADQLENQPLLFKQATPAAKTTSTTLTAAEIIGGFLTGNQGAAGAASYQLPTGAAIEAALIALKPDLANDDSFEFTVLNLSTVAAEDITLTTNTNLTLVGNMVVESNEATAQKGPVGRFLVRRTAAETYSVYRAG